MSAPVSWLYPIRPKGCVQVQVFDSARVHEPRVTWWQLIVILLAKGTFVGRARTCWVQLWIRAHFFRQKDDGPWTDPIALIS